MKESRLRSRGGIFGYGFPKASLRAGLEYGARHHAPLLDLEIPI
jgi:hypothetical protein